MQKFIYQGKKKKFKNTVIVSYLVESEEGLWENRRKKRMNKKWRIIRKNKGEIYRWINEYRYTKNRGCDREKDDYFTGEKKKKRI